MFIFGITFTAFLNLTETTGMLSPTVKWHEAKRLHPHNQHYFTVLMVITSTAATSFTVLMRLTELYVIYSHFSLKQSCNTTDLRWKCSKLHAKVSEALTKNHHLRNNGTQIPKMGYFVLHLIL